MRFSVAILTFVSYKVENWFWTRGRKRCTNACFLTYFHLIHLGEPNFIKQLMNFDKDNITDRVLKKIGQYCAQADFQPDIIGRVSSAAKSLCMWVRAMEVRHENT